MSYLGSAEEFFKIKLEHWQAKHPELSPEFLQIQTSVESQLLTDPFENYDPLTLFSEGDDLHYTFDVEKPKTPKEDGGEMKVFLSLMLAAAGYRAKVESHGDLSDREIILRPKRRRRLVGDGSHQSLYKSKI